MLKIWACWEKTCQTSKTEKKEVWFYAHLCFWKRWLAQLASCLRSWIFGVLYSQFPWVMKAKHKHILISPYLIPHPSFQSSVPFDYYLCTSSLCCLASSSQIQRLYCKITLVFPLKCQLASSFLSFGKHPFRSSLPYVFFILIALSIGILSHHTHAAFPVASASLSALCFSNLTFRCSLQQHIYQTWPSVAARSHSFYGLPALGHLLFLILSAHFFCGLLSHFRSLLKCHLRALCPDNPI